MSTSRAVRPPGGSGFRDMYDTWPSSPGSSRRFIFVECCPCDYSSRRCRLSWTLMSCLEILVLSLAMIAYFFISNKALGQMLSTDGDSAKAAFINELSEWLIRLFASMIVMQIVLLICGIAFGEVTARKIIYWGLLTGNVLSVAIYAAFVHSMSTWNATNIAFVVILSTFGLIRIVVLVLNPVWWIWKTVPII